MAELSSREVKKRKLKDNMVSSSKDYIEDEEQLKNFKKKKKKIRRMIIIILLVLFTIATIAYFMVMRYYKYSNYDVRWEKDMNQGSFVGYEYFGDNILKYSKDGATYIDNTGKDVWIDSYEMNSPVASVSKNYAAISDVQGNTISIYNADGKTGTVTTLLPITKIAVADNGTVVAIVEDSSASYITFYKKDGTAIDVTIKSILSGDGYPTDLSLSPDGTQLIVGYEYLDNGEMRGRVVFYDFSEIGQNIPNRLVGGFDEQFTNSLIGRVKFINSTYSFCAADSGLYFFSSKNIASPKLIKSIVAEDEIQTVMYSENYVGIICKNGSGAHTYRFEIYKPNGDLVCKTNFDSEYKYADIEGNYIFLYSDSKCLVYNMSGVIKISQDIDFSLAKISKGPWPTEFIFTGVDRMQSLNFR